LAPSDTLILVTVGHCAIAVIEKTLSANPNSFLVIVVFILYILKLIYFLDTNLQREIIFRNTILLFITYSKF